MGGEIRVLVYGMWNIKCLLHTVSTFDSQVMSLVNTKRYDLRKFDFKEFLNLKNT